MLLYSPRDATTFAVGGPNSGATRITSWDVAARAWNVRLDFDFAGPRWSSAGGAAVDPISGLVWVLADPVSSWQPGASTWTDRSSVAMPPASGIPVPGGRLVFDERRGTLVLFVAGWSPSGGIGVLELALP